MHWQRTGNRRYAYRYARIDGKPRRIYCGAGEAADHAIMMDRRLREMRQKAAAARKADQQRVLDLQSHVQRLFDQSEKLIRASLINEGFYLYQRSRWKKRRVNANPTAKPPAPERAREAAS